MLALPSEHCYAPGGGRGRLGEVENSLEVPGVFFLEQQRSWQTEATLRQSSSLT